jgi:hypothetical protein
MRSSWKLAALLSTIALSGCAVGMVSARVPERALPSTAPPLAKRISFDVCGVRWPLGSDLSKALLRAGISAGLIQAPGTPVHLTITKFTESHYLWSVIVSALTLSVVPGYMVDRTRLDVSLAWRDSRQTERHGSFKYEYEVRTFVWAPLIVHPDFFVGLNGGWTSDKEETAGKDAFDRTVAVIAHDIRMRLDPAGTGAPLLDVDGVSCPKETLKLPEPGHEEWESVPPKNKTGLPEIR